MRKLSHALLLMTFAILALETPPASAGDDPPGLLGKAQRLKRLYDQIPQIYRVQFRVQTSRHSGAGTRSDIRVSLSDWHRTWIDTPGGDREQGVVATYDLFTLDYLRHPLLRLDNIEYLEIENTGDDHWAIVFFELLVNGEVVYHERFPERHWIGRGRDRSTTYRVPGEILRGSDTWQAWTYRLPETFVIPRADLESVLEGFVGHHIMKLRILDWGISRVVQDRPGYMRAEYDGITLSRVDESTLRIRMDVEAKLNNKPNPDFRLETTVHFHSEANTLVIRVSRVRVDGRGPVGYLANVIAEVEGRVNRRIQAEVEEAGKKLAESGSRLSLRVVPDTGGDVELTIRDLPVKISILVHPEGDVQLVPF